MQARVRQARGRGGRWRAAVLVLAVLGATVGLSSASDAAPAAPHPDLAVGIDQPLDTPVAGLHSHFAMRVVNVGDGTAVHATLSITMSTALSVRGITQTSGAVTASCTHTASTVSCQLGDLAPIEADPSSAESDFDLDIVPTAAAATRTITAVVASNGPEPSPDTNNPNTDTRSFGVVQNRTDLGLTETSGSGPATVGVDSRLEYELTSTGPAPVGDAQIVVTVPVGLTVRSVQVEETDTTCTTAGQVVTCDFLHQLSPIIPHVTYPIELVVRPTVATGMALSVAVRSSTPEPSPDPHPNSVVSLLAVAPRVADLGATFVSTSQLEVDRPDLFSVDVTNHGPGAATAVTVDLTPPDGIHFGTAGYHGGASGAGLCQSTFGEQVVTCAIGDILSGETVSIIADLSLSDPGTDLPITVAIHSATTEPSPDPHPDTVTQLVDVAPRERHLTGRVLVPGVSPAGIRVSLIAANGAVRGQASVDSQGRYILYGTPGGRYHLLFDDPAHRFAPVLRSNPLILDPTSDRTIADQHLLFLSSFHVFVSTNASAGVPGTTVRVFRVGTTYTPVVTVVTDEDGGALVTGLPPGDYQVQAVPPSGNATAWYGNTPDRSGAATYPVAGDDQGELAGIDIRVGPSAAISGTVRQPGLGEPGQPGVVVQAFLAGTSALPVATTTTGADGTYALRDLPAGAYQVHFVPGPGYLAQWYGGYATRAASPRVIVDPGETEANVDETLRTAP